MLRQRLILAFILLLAAALRFTDLAISPPGFNQDEAVNGYDAWCLGKTLHDHHGDFLPLMLRSFNDWTSPVLTYLSIPAVCTIGLSEFSVRFTPALLGTLSIWLFFLLVRITGGSTRIALTGSFLLCIMPWHITLSRWAIPPSVVPFFLILSLLLFFRSLKESLPRKAMLRFSLAGLCFAILTYAYPTQKLFVPLLLLALVLIFLRKRIIMALSLMLPYGLLVLPLFLKHLMEPGKYNMRFAGISLWRNSSSVWDFSKGFLERYFEYLSPGFLFGSGDSDSMHQVPGMELTYSFLSFFFYLGIIFCFYSLFVKKRDVFLMDRRISLMLLASILLYPIAASLTTDHGHMLRVVQGLPLVLLMICLGLEGIQRYTGEFLKLKLVTMTILLLGSYQLFRFQHQYFKEYREDAEIRKRFQYGLKEAFLFALAHEKEYSMVVADKRINMPYIYYLFYVAYDPNKLNYAEINEHGMDGWLQVSRIGKYHFEEIPSNLGTGSLVVHEVYNGERPCFRLYSKDNILYIVVT